MLANPNWLTWMGMAICIGVSGCKGGGRDGQERRGRQAGQNGEPALVAADTLEMRTIARRIEAVTTLAGRGQADVYARVSGKLSFIGPSEGKKVRAGEVLFRVDRSDPGEDYLATPVVSPITGWVGRWLVSSLGSPILPQQTVVTVVDDEVLRATVAIPTELWQHVRTDTLATIRIEDETRPSTVTAIARSAEAQTGRGFVTLDIGNSDHSWKVGMVAVVELALDPRPRLLLPAQALTITDKGAYVFVIEDGKAHRVPIRFEPFDNDRSLVTDKSLQSGNRIITEGMGLLTDGSTVRVVEQGAKGKS